MNEDLKKLIDYKFNLDKTKKVIILTLEELTELVNQDNIKIIYGVLEDGVTEPWYYLITKDNKEIFIDINDNEDKIDALIGKILKKEKEEYIELTNKELEYIYNLNNVPIISKYDGTKIRVLEYGNDYSLIEWIGNYEPYIIALKFNKETGSWLSGRYFKDLIQALKTYKKEYKFIL